MKSRMLVFVFLMLTAGIRSVTAQSTPLPPPGSSGARPASDLSHATAGHTGTTYVMKQKSERGTAAAEVHIAGPANEQFASVASALAQVVVTPVARRHIRPTSDYQNASSADTVSMLMLQANPQSVTTANLMAYTQYELLGANGAQPAASAVPGGLSPKTVAGLYGVPQNSGSGVIAIVDAFHYPQAKNDLDRFSQQFGLPALPMCPAGSTVPAQPCLRIEAQANAATNCGWAGEAALDLQWAHAIAPRASLIFVEAASNSYSDLFAAIKIAVADVMRFGGGEISLSWGGGEFPSETQTDTDVFVDGPLYFASSGDVGGLVIYPAASPKVISVGGTVLFLDNNGQRIAAEAGWQDSGGGTSAYESLPQYQAGVENMPVNRRNIPDIAADASPDSGVSVFISTPNNTCVDNPPPSNYQPGWQTVGGTSLAAPVIAAMVNVSGKNRPNVAAELTAIYGNRSNNSRITDIKLGKAGGNSASVGYDNVTGVGVPVNINFDADPGQGPTTP